VIAALADDDLDRAIDAGLLEVAACPSCNAECTRELLHAREAREQALAARQRYRNRQARLKRLADERAARRAATSPATASNRPALLPTAAAAALARAKARAAARDRS
jgi:Na+-translocating ferredoxin:NAD+ oxidoreductase RnfC subunit